MIERSGANFRSSATPVPPESARRDPDWSRLELAAENRGSSARAPDIVPIARVLNVLVVVPTLDAGAADAGAIDLTRILVAGGHRPIVVSRGGRMEAEVGRAGGEFVRIDVASRNPARMLRSAAALARLIRRTDCAVVHAHGRAAAWSAYFAARSTGVPFITTWYKGFREQNLLKRFYNSVMARGERVIAVSDQIAEIINERHGTAWERIVVIPSSVDIARYDPAAVPGDAVEAMRRAWGVKPDTKVILVPGRILRRKGHPVVVRAVRRLKDLGLKDFLCVFAGEDHGRSGYVGELWDLVIETETADVVRLIGAADDLPAAYAAAHVVVSGAIQPEGLQHVILEAQAMARPVIVSDLGAGPDAVLAPPAVPEDRMTGLRVPAGDDAALAAALIRLFSLAEPARRAIGARGRVWVAGQFDRATATAQTLAVYGELAARRGR